jgi:hypothetical protein
MSVAVSKVKVKVAAERVTPENKDALLESKGLGLGYIRVAMFFFLWMNKVVQSSVNSVMFTSVCFCSRPK